MSVVLDMAFLFGQFIHRDREQVAAMTLLRKCQR